MSQSGWRWKQERSSTSSLAVECGNPWDSQSERVYHGDGAWHSLNANESGGQSRDAVLAISENQRNELRLSDKTNALSCGGGKPGQGYTAVFEKAKVYSFDSLSSNSMKSNNPYSGCHKTETAKTLDCFDPNPSKNQGGICVLSVDCRNATESETATTLQAKESGGYSLNCGTVIRTINSE